MKKIATLVLLVFTYSLSISQTAKLDNEQLLDLIQGQRYTEAVNYIKSVYPDIITDQKIKSRLAYCNYMSGNLPDAEKSYLSILFADTTNRSALNYLAAINIKRRNYQQAKVFYMRLLKLDTMNVNVYKLLAANAENLLDTTGVYNNLLKANNLSPQDPDVAYDLSKILIKKKKYPAADTVLKKAIAADPQNVLLIDGRLELAFNLKDYKQAVIYAKQALQLGDLAAQTYSILGMSYYYLGQYKNSLDMYLLIEKLANSNETTYYYTSLTYRKLDSIQKSNDYLLKSIKDGISDNIAIYYQELSINNETLKKYKTSILHLDKAEEFEAKNVFNYSRARIYDINLKDQKNALKYYNRYIKQFNPKVDDKECYNYSAQRAKELSPKAVVNR